MESPRWEAKAGSEVLNCIPSLVRSGAARDFVNHLSDTRRSCPAVLVSKDFNLGVSLVNPQRLAKLLAGSALVFESESSWVDKELETLLPPGFRCWNGMVRIYQTRLRLEAPDDVRRHRYFTGKDIQAIGPSEAEEQIVRGIVRRARTSISPGIVSVEDVVAKQAEIRIQGLREQSRGSQEWVEVVEAENTRLSLLLQKKDEEMVQWIDQVEELEGLRNEPVSPGIRKSRKPLTRRKRPRASEAHSQLL